LIRALAGLTVVDLVRRHQADASLREETPCVLAQHRGQRITRTEPLHFLQIWVLPDRQGLALRYIRRPFWHQKNADACGSSAHPMVATDRSSFIRIRIYDALLSSGDAVTNNLKPGHKSWVQVVRGAVEVNGKAADAGDGLAVEDEAVLTAMSHADDSEVLVFDLP
jgi:quercetin 2,3-dioxygenase